ncbi:MAG: adenosylcobalamin-5-phosphate phosphatase [Nitrospirae bacterium]|jgi:alpha-ribazole phosphatase/probable phosphoglycerate mutase|nr:adenosylcobalamin-5-phosphate phosphatase [Nitrospirota bacterium]
MVTRVYLMRHGEVDNGGEKRYNGHIDVDITPKGVEQMHRLAGLLEGKPVTAVYSSDLIRSVKGARIISERLGLSSAPVRALRERSVGQWEGLTAEEIKQRFPEEYKAWRADLLSYRPPAGECLQDVRNRILPEYRRIIALHPDQEIAMLLHGGVNRVILADALGLDPLNLFRIDQAFGALNIIDHYDDGMAVVKLLNG